MITNPTQRNAAPLFAGLDAQIFTLPDDVVQARARIGQLVAAEPTPPATDEGELFEAAARAAATGEPLDVAAIAKHRAASNTHGLSRQVHERALEIADAHLAAVLADSADAIITEHLRPVHDEIASEARDTFAKLTGVPETAGSELLLQMGKAARDAWLRADEIAQSWVAVRNARAAAIRLGHNAETADELGYFAECRNAELIRPWILRLSRPHIAQSEADNVPTSGRARLRWYLEHDAQLWLPTIREQNAEHDRVFGERMAEIAANRHALAGFRALAG